MPAQKESNSWRRRAADAVEAEDADDNLFPKPPGPRVVLSVLAMLLAAAFVPKMQHGLAARVDRGPAVPRPPPPQLVRPPAPTLPPPAASDVAARPPLRPRAPAFLRLIGRRVAQGAPRRRDLRGADLREASLVGAALGGCNLGRKIGVCRGVRNAAPPPPPPQRGAQSVRHGRWSSRSTP